MTATRWLLILPLSLTAAASGYSAKPLSIQFLENKTSADGAATSRYQLKCTNGRKYVLTARDNKARWCIGEQDNDECETQQIKAARAACSFDQPDEALPDPSVVN